MTTPSHWHNARTWIFPRTIYTAAETFLDYILCSDAVPDPNSGDRPQADIMTQHTDMAPFLRLRHLICGWYAPTSVQEGVRRKDRLSELVGATTESRLSATRTNIHNLQK